MALPVGTVTSGDQSLHNGLRARLLKCLICTWYAVLFLRLTTVSLSVKKQILKNKKTGVVVYQVPNSTHFTPPKNKNK